MKILDKKDDPDFGTVFKFEHDDLPPQGVNGKLFLDFSKYADFDYDRMDTEICLALAKTELNKYPIVTGVMPPKLQYGQFENEVMYNFNGDRNDVKDLPQMEKRKFLFFKHKSLLPWFFIIDLKPNLFVNRAHDNYPWSEFSDLTPYTKQCIEKLPFKSVGRVVIYGSWPQADVPCHRDWIPDGVFNHHINFNPGGYRPVYIYDSVTDTKHYLPKDHKLYAYQTTDYHGVDALPHFSYTIRVDGVFNDDVVL
jgi:hypothetical protein